MRKMIALILTLVMCCTLMTGCVGEIATVKIEPNGSGTIDMQFGFTDEAIETMVALGTGPKEIEHYKPFVYNGVTYYGETIKQKFNNVSEFNDIMNGNAGVTPKEIAENTGAFNLAIDEMGAFNFTLDVSASEENIGVDVSEYTEEEIKTLTENMQILFTLTFPANVTQVEGEKNGVKINGNTIKLDFLKMSENEGMRYRFITGIPNETKFTDVADSFWASNAINSLANGGLVSGIGNNQFAPNRVLTRAEFYQILARSTGLKTGTENDYWAYTAIKSCGNFGFILKPFDEITEEEFNVPILREEAVAALIMARDYNETSLEQVSGPIMSIDIPDYAEIDDLYKKAVLTGYEFGVTNGVDSKKTFNPKGELTRAQGCQMFYNLNWCTVPR